MTASLSDCGTRFRLVGKYWTLDEPVSQLGRWVQFYKDMARGKGLKVKSSLDYRLLWRRQYGPTYAALRILQRQISTQ